MIYFYMVNLFDVRVKIVAKLNHSQNYPSTKKGKLSALQSGFTLNAGTSMFL